jgi:Cu2+-containing amine oxidase
VIEYSFRDDGTIGFRLGATGHNYPGSEAEPHMHNALWRIDINLDGPDHNTVMLCEHLEPDPNRQKSQAASLVTPFNNGKEGFADFEPEKFTMLRVINTQKKNAKDKSLAYDLIPYRMGNSRHHGNIEECTHHDFWVSKNRPGETNYRQVPQYVQKAENIVDTDVVIWYCAAGHHEPRSEDGEMRPDGQGRPRFQGATPIMWTQFELRPRDIWDRSPYFPYSN